MSCLHSSQNTHRYTSISTPVMSADTETQVSGTVFECNQQTCVSLHVCQQNEGIAVGWREGNSETEQWIEQKSGCAHIVRKNNRLCVHCLWILKGKVIGEGENICLRMCLLTTLLSCTSGFMVSCTTNQVAFRRINAVIRFQWMIFLRHRILLRMEGKERWRRRKMERKS